MLATIAVSPNASAQAKPPVVLVPADPARPWWERPLTLRPSSAAIGAITLRDINARLRRVSPHPIAQICAIAPVDGDTIVGADPTTRDSIAATLARYPGAFAATLTSYAGESADYRVVAYRTCGDQGATGLAILGVGASGKLESFDPSDRRFIRFERRSTRSFEVFDCFDCAKSFLQASVGDLPKRGRWRPLPPVAGPLPPPAALRADPFYAKYVDADGIPVLASAKVPDAALLAARGMMHAMIRHRPELALVLAEAGQRVVIAAEDEAITDIPENRGWTKPARDDPRLTICERKHYDERIGRLSDRDYWNRRERAVGGLVMVDGAEDVLGLKSSRWYGETVFVHEFAHRILYAIAIAAPRLRARIEAAYHAAMAKGLWRGEYAATTVDEYWAKGTQTWFNSNFIAIIDGRQILTDRDLKAYDPKLYAVLGAVYGRYHAIAGDPFYNDPARVPPGLLPRNTAEQC